MNKRIPVAITISAALIALFNINAFSSGLENYPLNLLTTPIPFSTSQLKAQVTQSPTPSPSPTPIPTPVPKGVTYYENFPDIVDFSSYAKHDAAKIIAYPLEYEDVQYLESPIYSFRYQKRIYDYLETTSQKADDYAKFLVTLGFTKLNSLDYQKLEDYSERLKDELLHDIDFKLSTILFNDADSEFTLVLIGQSKVTRGDIVDQDCVEIRLYSLKMIQTAANDLSLYTQNFKDQIKKEVPQKK